MSSLKEIKDCLLKAIQKAGFEAEPDQLHLERAKTPEHGHFATNIAMLIAGKMGSQPRETAEKMAAEFKKMPFIEKADIAGPGFINLWIEQNFYSEICRYLAEKPEDYLKKEWGVGAQKTIVIDYSHPNIAKPMGVHHLLSTIIGDSIKKLYRKIGYKVIADNFIGDLGTQFGKLIHAIKTWGNPEEIEKDPINTLLKLYVKFHIEADKDVELDDEGRAEYKKFEEGDPENRALWKKIVRWSLMEIQPIYDRLGIQFDYLNGESFYEDKMPAILEQGRRTGLFTDGKDGAWIVLPENPEDAPAVVRKADGTTLYITRDLARIKYWEEQWHPDLMVNVVDCAQEFHFRKLFEVAKKMNLTQAPNIHVAFGRMQFKDMKMSTRTGNIIRLTELLDEAEKRALAVIREKGGADLTEEERKALSRGMGVNSVKYNILHQNRVQNLTFEWDKMLSFEGNSAPYLMYTIARAKSVLRKSGEKPEKISSYSLALSDNHEVNLVADMTLYPRILKRAADEFKPNHLANYLYQLAQEFNAFYNALPILQAEPKIRNSRLLVTRAVLRVMEDIFGILGMGSPEKM